jgi:hypothetical protein
MSIRRSCSKLGFAVCLMMCVGTVKAEWGSTEGRQLKQLIHRGVRIEPLERRVLLSASGDAPAAGGGLLGEYFATTDFQGPALRRVDPSIDFDWSRASPDHDMPSDRFSVRWSGQLIPQYDEVYTLSTRADDGVRLWLDDELIIDDWHDKAATTVSAEVRLEAGVRREIRVEYYENRGLASVQLFWSSPSTELQPIASAHLLPAPVLKGGHGWKDSTDQPPSRGQGAYADAKAIARWNVVPHQTFEGYFDLGVVAFHASGIEKVSFSVNDGPWADVYQMTVNARTAGNGFDPTSEYWSTLDARRFADGELEVRAIVHPVVGEPRVLQGRVASNDTMPQNGEHSLFLHANALGTLATPSLYVRPSTGSDQNPGTLAKPFATLERAMRGTPDGATVILLEPGTYSGNRHDDRAPTVNNTRWITVQPAEGLRREEVIINDAGSGKSRYDPNVRLLRWENISFDWTGTPTYQSVTRYAWFSNSRWYNSSGTMGEGGAHHYLTGVYFTESICEDRFMGPWECIMVRNAIVRRVAGDVFTNTNLTINARIEDFGNQDDWQYHSDIWQFYRDRDNVIAFGVSGHNIGTSQVFMLAVNQTGVSMRNSAFVDVSIDYSGTGPQLSQLQGKLQHVLFDRVASTQHMHLSRSMGVEKLDANNIVFRACVLPNLDELVRENRPGFEFIDCIQAGE